MNKIEQLAGYDIDGQNLYQDIDTIKRKLNEVIEQQNQIVEMLTKMKPSLRYPESNTVNIMTEEK